MDDFLDTCGLSKLNQNKMTKFNIFMTSSVIEAVT